jgi:hypothetical protein
MEMLLEYTIHSFETKFSQVEGMTEEISFEITNFVKESFSHGPRFEALVGRLSSKFDLNMANNVKFFSQLEVVFRESLIDGFTTVLYSEGDAESTTETASGSTHESSSESSESSSSSSHKSSSSSSTTTGGSTETTTGGSTETTTGGSTETTTGGSTETTTGGETETTTGGSTESATTEGANTEG